MTVAELREALANVPDYYSVVIDRPSKRSQRGYLSYTVAHAEVEPAGIGTHNLLAFVLTMGCDL